jgi:hypothetical protein
LEIASRNIKRKFGAVEHTFKHDHIIGNNFLDVVRNVNLVIIKLNLSLKGFVFVIYLREEKDSFEVQGVIGIDMNVEKRILEISEYFLVKVIVFFLGAFACVFKPKRCRFIDWRLFLFAFLVFLYFLEILVWVSKHPNLAHTDCSVLCTAQKHPPDVSFAY